MRQKYPRKISAARQAASRAAIVLPRGSFDKIIQRRSSGSYNDTSMRLTKLNVSTRHCFSSQRKTESAKSVNFPYGNCDFLERRIGVRAKERNKRVLDVRIVLRFLLREHEFCASICTTTIKASPCLAFIELRDSTEIILQPNADRGRRYGVNVWMCGYS